MGFKSIPYRLLFDFKFELRRNDRRMNRRSFTDNPTEDVFSCLMSLEIVQVTFLVGDLNILGMLIEIFGDA